METETPGLTFFCDKDGDVEICTGGWRAQK